MSQESLTSKTIPAAVLLETKRLRDLAAFVNRRESISRPMDTTPLDAIFCALTEYADLLEAKPPSEATGSPWTYCWLIEMQRDGHAEWWYGNGFTDDAADAIRFCREQDADGVILERGLVDAEAVQHGFMDGSAPVEPKPSEASGCLNCDGTGVINGCQPCHCQSRKSVEPPGIPPHEHYDTYWHPAPVEPLGDAARFQWLADNARRIDFSGLSVSDMAQLRARIDEARNPSTKEAP